MTVASICLGLEQPPVTLKNFENVNLEGVKIGVDWTYLKVSFELFQYSIFMNTYLLASAKKMGAWGY